MSANAQSGSAVQDAEQALVDAMQHADTPEEAEQIVGALAVLRRGDAGE